VNDHNCKLNSDFIGDEMPGLQRRDFLRLGGLSAIWALSVAMAPRFLFGANSQPVSPKTIHKTTGSGSYRPQAVGREGSTPQNQIHPAAAKQSAPGL
jgi:hypothetical protein